ncbi:hypothetical protein B2J93_8555 [Marssonina coronariae]|uniref:Uncharacterized protein n=1 Tax=Diplocarpon coronariae TaxID=2795749 RepID=A0A218YY86_9HELO|nr:hypothetical protein B2J93_8555 [Marssonina coronariae]
MSLSEPFVRYTHRSSPLLDFRRPRRARAIRDHSKPAQTPVRSLSFGTRSAFEYEFHRDLQSRIKSGGLHSSCYSKKAIQLFGIATTSDDPLEKPMQVRPYTGRTIVAQVKVYWLKLRVDLTVWRRERGLSNSIVALSLSDQALDFAATTEIQTVASSRHFIGNRGGFVAGFQPL